MTPDDTQVFLECSRNARNLVKRSVGFFDDDLAQDACEAMFRAVGTYKTGTGASLKTWLLTKGKWNIIDQYRNRTKIRSLGYQKSVPLDPVVQQSALMVDDPGYERVEELLAAISSLKSVPYLTTLRGFSLRNREVIKHVVEDGETQFDAGQHVVPPMDESQVSQLMKKFRQRMRGMNKGMYNKGP